MPVCPECQTPYDEWQHFCLQCGHYLRAGPPPSLRCPRCGTQVSIKQNFCHECAAPLKTEMHHPAAAASRKWLVGGVVAVLLGLGVILALQITRWPSPPPSQMVKSPVPSQALESPASPLREAEKPAVQGETDSKASGTTVSSLHADLEEVFNKIREANLNKNILLYMSTFSVVYPELDKKRQEVFKTWEKFEFKKMAFTVDKFRDVGSVNAVAEVNWSTTTQNLATQDLRTDDFQYRVWFTKELGQWKIKKIEELQP